MDKVHVSPDASEGWWDDGRRLRFFSPDGRCWQCVHGTMDEVYVSPDERSEDWKHDGQRPRFSRLMYNAGRASMEQWMRFMYCPMLLKGGGAMVDVCVFLARWTMLSARPWDDGRDSCIALLDI